MKKPRNGIALTAVVAFLLVGPACVVNEEDDDPELTEMSAAVEAFDFYFRSTTVILEPDTEATVTLTNNGSALHSFSVPDLDVEIEAEGGESAQVTFATTGLAGAYEFLCKYHPEEMNGTLTVGADVDVDEDDDDVEVDVDATEDDDV